MLLVELRGVVERLVCVSRALVRVAAVSGPVGATAVGTDAGSGNTNEMATSAEHGDRAGPPRRRRSSRNGGAHGARDRRLTRALAARTMASRTSEASAFICALPGCSEVLPTTPTTLCGPSSAARRRCAATLHRGPLFRPVQRGDRVGGGSSAGAFGLASLSDRAIAAAIVRQEAHAVLDGAGAGQRFARVSRFLSAERHAMTSGAGSTSSRPAARPEPMQGDERGNDYCENRHKTAPACAGSAAALARARPRAHRPAAADRAAPGRASRACCASCTGTRCTRSSRPRAARG